MAGRWESVMETTQGPVKPAFLTVLLLAFMGAMVLPAAPAVAASCSITKQTVPTLGSSATKVTWSWAVSCPGLSGYSVYTSATDTTTGKSYGTTGTGSPYSASTAGATETKTIPTCVPTENWQDKVTVRSASGSVLVGPATTTPAPICGPTPPPPPPPPASFMDTFGRLATASWGIADTGQAWSVDQGSTAQFAVDGSEGTIQGIAGKAPIISIQDAATDVRARFMFSSNPVGATQSYGVGLDYRDPANYVRAIVTQSLTGTTSVMVQSQIANVNTYIVTPISLPAQQPDTWYWLELSWDSPTVWSVRVWPDGTDRPDQPTGTASFTGQIPTGTGFCVRQQVVAGNKNLPLTSVDDVSAG
jgi:hypothetical protein